MLGISLLVLFAFLMTLPIVFGSSIEIESVDDFKTWAKGFDTAPSAGGKTAGTFSKIGTITVPNKREPVYMYGLLVLVGAQIVTAGESGLPELELNSSDLGLFKERFVLPEFGFTDPIATNTQAIPVSSKFIGLAFEDPVNNKDLDVHLSSAATMTGDWDMHAAIIFGNKPISQVPDDYLDELKNQFTSNVRSLGRIEDDAAKAVGSADTDIPLTGIEIINKATQLVALVPHVVPNAPTASEEVVTRHTFESGDITDFAPQEYPSIVGYHPSLGTIVGGAKGTTMARGYPVRFPLPQTKFTMGVKAQNVIVLSNAPDFAHGAKFRTKQFK